MADDLRERVTRVETLVSTLPCEKMTASVTSVAKSVQEYVHAGLNMDARIRTNETRLQEMRDWIRTQEKLRLDMKSQKIALVGSILVALIAAVSAVLIAILKGG